MQCLGEYIFPDRYLFCQGGRRHLLSGQVVEYFLKELLGRPVAGAFVVPQADAGITLPAVVLVSLSEIVQ